MWPLDTAHREALEGYAPGRYLCECPKQENLLYQGKAIKVTGSRDNSGNASESKAMYRMGNTCSSRKVQL